MFFLASSYEDSGESSSPPMGGKVVPAAVCRPVRRHRHAGTLTLFLYFIFFVLSSSLPFSSVF